MTGYAFHRHQTQRENNETMTDRKRFDIEVTRLDIERGIRDDSSHCVVARAVARTVPDATRIEVDTQAIRFTKDQKRLVYLTPWAVQSYVVAFDAGDEIGPFAFRIANPIEIKRKPYVPAKAREVRQLSMTPDAIKQREAKAQKRAASPAIAEAETKREKAPPRVFRRGKRRSYGHRLLRINQAQQPG